MMDTNEYAFSHRLLTASFLACIVVSVLLFSIACNDNTPPPTSSAGMTGAGSAKPKAKKNADKSSQAKKATDATNGGAPEEEVPAGPQVEVTDLLVDAPGVDFTGPGRYNLTVSALAAEVVEPAVWQITAYGEDGKVVGKQDQFLMLSSAKPRTLLLNDFYCTSIPVKVEITLTDKEADRGEAAAGGEEQGGGAGAGKSGLDAGGGKKPPADKGGGGAKPPAEDSGDEGGGDNEENL